MKFYWVLITCFFLGACSSPPPHNLTDLCSIFSEKPDWYENARAAAKLWAVPVPAQLAVIKQESAFVEDARPPRQHWLGIPLTRPSTAFGYGQATDATWQAYRLSTGNHGADRDDFADSTDFVAWYFRQTVKKLGISAHDVFHQYLAYHEGHVGYQQGQWRGNAALMQTARKVQTDAARFQRQIKACQPKLEAKIS